MDHSWNCDFVRFPGQADNECYCPTPEDRRELATYQRRLAEDGEPPEPHWVTPYWVPPQCDCGPEGNA